MWGVGGCCQLSAVFVLFTCVYSNGSANGKQQWNFVKRVNHSTECFTEGLLYLGDSTLVLESCGLKGKSQLLVTNEHKGTTVTYKRIPAEYFAEGVTVLPIKSKSSVDDTGTTEVTPGGNSNIVLVLTYTQQKILVYKLDYSSNYRKDVLTSSVDSSEDNAADTSRQLSADLISEVSLRYAGAIQYLPLDGWGMTADAERGLLYVSDGGSTVGLLDAAWLSNAAEELIDALPCDGISDAPTETAYRWYPDQKHDRTALNKVADNEALLSDLKHDFPYFRKVIKLVQSDGVCDVSCLSSLKLNALHFIRPESSNSTEEEAGLILANSYGTNEIYCVDLAGGNVLDIYDFSPIVGKHSHIDTGDHMNGIAVHPENGHMVLTGKHWDSFYVFKLRDVQLASSNGDVYRTEGRSLQDADAAAALMEIAKEVAPEAEKKKTHHDSEKKEKSEHKVELIQEPAPEVKSAPVPEPEVKPAPEPKHEPAPEPVTAPKPDVAPEPAPGHSNRDNVFANDYMEIPSPNKLDEWQTHVDKKDAIKSQVVFVNGPGSSNSTDSDLINAEVAQIVNDLHQPKSKYLNWLSQFFSVVFAATWVFSFYPQLILNFRSKSVAGFSFDFVVYNILGYTCYLTYCITRYVVEKEYSLYYAVKLHDVVFAAHALLLCLIYAVQLFMYRRTSTKQGVGTWCKWISAIFITVASTNALLAIWRVIPWYVKHPVGWNLDASIFAEAIQKITAGYDRTSYDRLLQSALEIHWVQLESWSFIQCMAFIKLLINVVKYFPQLVLNCKRRSTKGLASWSMILDFFSACFAFSQNMVDAVNYDNWKYITGNIPKVVVSVLSASLTLVIIGQIYCLYRGRDPIDVPYERVKEDGANGIGAHIQLGFGSGGSPDHIAGEKHHQDLEDDLSSEGSTTEVV